MEFPHLGEHCTEASCNRLDFLPLKCDACSSIFCAEHISYILHNCPSSYKKDVQVPVCPLCNAPVPSKRGDPPDIAVGLHMDAECKERKQKEKVFRNKCSFQGCRNKEMIPVRCSECLLNFCLRHRHGLDHNCQGSKAVHLRRLKNIQERCKNNNGDLVKNIQGGISEDEALARALQASMLEDSQRRITVPGNRERCRLS